MVGLAQEAMQITAELNAAYHEPEEIRAFISKLIGKPVDDSFAMLPPFYTDCGKNITIGKNVFINSGCRFQDILSYGDVLSAIGIKWREYGKGFIHRFSNQLRDKSADFLRFVIHSVQLRCDSHGFLCEADHKYMSFRAAWNRQAVVYMIQKQVEIHFLLALLS
jgi:hypothetical protein